MQRQIKCKRKLNGRKFSGNYLILSAGQVPKVPLPLPAFIPALTRVMWHRIIMAKDNHQILKYLVGIKQIHINVFHHQVVQLIQNASVNLSRT